VPTGDFEASLRGGEKEGYQDHERGTSKHRCEGERKRDTRIMKEGAREGVGVKIMDGMRRAGQTREERPTAQGARERERVTRGGGRPLSSLPAARSLRLPTPFPSHTIRPRIQPTWKKRAWRS
jgi:hypothetical protein